MKGQVRLHMGIEVKLSTKACDSVDVDNGFVRFVAGLSSGRP